MRLNRGGWWELDLCVDVMKQRVEMVLHLSRSASFKRASSICETRDHAARQGILSISTMHLLLSLAARAGGVERCNAGRGRGVGTHILLLGELPLQLPLGCVRLVMLILAPTCMSSRQKRGESRRCPEIHLHVAPAMARFPQSKGI